MYYVVGVTRDTQNKPTLEALLFSDTVHPGEIAQTFTHGLMIVDIGHFFLGVDALGTGGLDLTVTAASFSPQGVKAWRHSRDVVARSIAGLRVKDFIADPSAIREALTLIELRHQKPEQDWIGKWIQESVISFIGFKQELKRK